MRTWWQNAHEYFEKQFLCHTPLKIHCQTHPLLIDNKVNIHMNWALGKQWKTEFLSPSRSYYHYALLHKEGVVLEPILKRNNTSRDCPYGPVNKRTWCA